jgi:hypothetical protein
MDTHHFATAASLDAARALLTFEPVEPRDTAGRARPALRVHVRDHRRREIPVADRTLEAHYGSFVFTQSRKGAGEARRLALTVRYGPEPREAEILGRPARAYELGPEVPPDDVDGRSPAVVAWADGEMFYFLASGELPADDLIRIATSVHAPAR